MPPVIPFLVTIGTVIVANIPTIITGLIGIGLSYGIQSLFGKSKSGSSQNLSDLQTGAMQTIRSSSAPRRVVYGKARVGGVTVFGEVTGNENEYLHLIIVFTGHQVSSIDYLYFDDKLYSDNQFASFQDTNLHLGHPDQAANNRLMELCQNWTSAHRLRGCAYARVSLKWDDKLKAYPMGIPNITAHIHGKQCYDPRDGQTRWTENWALCVRDYLTADYGIGALPSEIDEASFIAAANLSDETVEVPGGYEKRYTCNGFFDLDEEPASIMADLLTAGAGTLVYTQGKYRLIGAAWTIPTYSLGVSDLRGPVNVITRIPRADLFNAVKGQFVDPLNFYQATDFPAVQSSEFADQDGEVIWRDIQFRFTQYSYTAQRLALLHLQKSRQAIQVTMPCKLTALKLAVWDMVSINNPSLGWVNKPFRIIHMRFGTDGGIDLDLREDSQASYAWNANNAVTIDTAPDTILPTPWILNPPSALLVTAIADRRADGTIVPLLRVTWTAPADAFLDHYEINWQRNLESEPWSGARLARDAGSFDILNTVEGTEYNIRIRSVNTLGVKSDWAEISSTGAQNTIPPDPPTNLVAIGGLKQITYYWTAPAASDLAGTELWVGTVNDRSDAGTYKVVFTPTDRWVHTVLPGTYYAWIRARDTSGNASTWEPVGQFAGAEATAENEAQAGIVEYLPVYYNNFELEDFGVWREVGGAIIQTDDYSYRGLYSGLTSTTATDGSQYVELELPVGNVVAMSGNRVRVQIFYHQPTHGNASDAAAVRIGSDNWSHHSDWIPITPDAGWQQLGFFFDIPGDATDIRVALWGDTTGAGRATLFDNLIVFCVSPGINAENIDEWIGSAAIGQAYMAAASIGSEQVINSSITNAKIGNEIKSNQYDPENPGHPGWRLAKDGDIDINGGALTIRNSAGDIIFEADGSPGLGLKNVISSLEPITAANVSTYIQSLAVDSLYIANNAVTVPQAASAGYYEIGTSYWTKINELTTISIPASRNDIVLFSIYYQLNSWNYGSARIKFLVQVDGIDYIAVYGESTGYINPDDGNSYNTGCLTLPQVIQHNVGVTQNLKLYAILDGSFSVGHIDFSNIIALGSKK